MGHSVKLFAGTASSLRPFLELSPEARLYLLTQDADIAVLPYDEAVHDALHRRFGTGDWPKNQRLRLSTTDQTFAAECSARSPLAYLETDYFGGTGWQSAALWQLGRLAVGPTSLQTGGDSPTRAPSLWPINVVLRALGVRASGDTDEFSTFGIDLYRSNDDIHEQAYPLRL